MNRQRLLVAALLLAGLVVIALVILIPRLGRTETLTGYIEGEPLYLEFMFRVLIFMKRRGGWHGLSFCMVKQTVAVLFPENFAAVLQQFL